MSSGLPKTVAALCTNFGAWIVGSAADPNNPSPRDFDVLVPWSEWNRAAWLIPEGTPSNKFGGFKLVEDGVKIDVWPGDLAWLLTQARCRHAYHPPTQTYVKPRRERKHR